MPAGRRERGGMTAPVDGIPEWHWPDDWPTFDLSSDPGSMVREVCTMTVDELRLCGGP